MRTFMIGTLVVAVLFVASGCKRDDPVNGALQICEDDPSVNITFPDPSYLPYYAQVVDFEWVSDTSCEIVSTRYLIMPVEPMDDMISALNEDPGALEEYWSRWRPFDERVGNTIRLDSELSYGYHLFAVQARSAGWKITEEFVADLNARIFHSRYRSDGPILELSELNYLGALSDYYPHAYPGIEFNWEVAGGCGLKFRIDANAEYYGRRVAGYRYGWDIRDLDRWDEPFTDINEIPERGFDSGDHYLTIEAIDDLGNVSTKAYRFTFVPMTMERDLLWVDDFPSTNAPSPVKTMPTEDEHDLFWEGLCSKNTGFDAGMDVYDVIEHNNVPPTLELLSHYKNVIWTYSSTENTAWSQMLRPYDRERKINILPMFMGNGGHVWTLGRSMRITGGLLNVLPDPSVVPSSVQCTTGENCGIDQMPSRDYGVTVVDGVIGTFRTGEEMPPGTVRSVDRDALRQAYSDESDPVTLAHPDLPATLELREEITDCPSCFFNLTDRGFSYAEVYNPEYWMDFNFFLDQPGFHPMYRMRAMNNLSPLDHQTIAIWVTKYRDVMPDVILGPAVAAPSAHMGFPLWFFDHDKANQIADVIFEEWGLLE
jgi:hypothetical protein